MFVQQLMFTPSPNDPLVEESRANGDSDGYQIVLPNELIVNIALLLDFNRFKFKDFSSGVTGDDDIDESLVFRGLPSNDSNNEITSETKEQDSVTNKGNFLDNLYCFIKNLMALAHVTPFKEGNPQPDRCGGKQVD